jgi:broad-specificity NMP kinase
VAGPVALTGTPGTGKSRVARALAGTVPSIEVADLALALGAGRRLRHGVEVDLPKLRRALARRGAWGNVELVVGHLAHLLPVRDVIVLRCRPTELERRLARARRGTVAGRFENFVAEATDVILLEAVARRRRIWEVDTTSRPVRSVAREVARRVRARGRASYGRVDWLADARVTAHLLDRPG